MSFPGGQSWAWGKIQLTQLEVPKVILIEVCPTISYQPLACFQLASRTSRLICPVKREVVLNSPWSYFPSIQDSGGTSLCSCVSCLIKKEKVQSSFVFSGLNQDAGAEGP